LKNVEIVKNLLPVMTTKTVLKSHTFCIQFKNFFRIRATGKFLSVKSVLWPSYDPFKTIHISGFSHRVSFASHKSAFRLVHCFLQVTPVVLHMSC